MDDPKFLEMIQMVEGHGAGLSQSGADRKGTRREDVVVTALSKMLKECLAPSDPKEFRKLTAHVYDWYKQQGVVLKNARPTGPAGEGKSGEVFPAMTSNVFPMAGQHPGATPRKQIHFADDNRKEENILASPRPQLPATVVTPKTEPSLDQARSGRVTAIPPFKDDPRGSGYGSGPSPGPGGAVRTAADVFRPYNRHSEDPLESARQQRRSRWQSRAGGEGGGEQEGGFEHELYVQMREHLDEKTPRTYVPESARSEVPREEWDPLRLRPQAHSTIDYYKSRDLLESQVQRNQVNAAMKAALEMTPEERLVQKMETAARAVKHEPPPHPLIDELARQAVKERALKERRAAEHERELERLRKTPYSVIAAERRGPPAPKSPKSKKAREALAAKEAKEAEERRLAEAAAARERENEESRKRAAAADDESGAGGGESSAEGRSSAPPGGDGSASAGAASGATPVPQLLPEKPARLARKVYPGPEVLDVMEKRWRANRHRDASETMESVEVSDVMAMWSMHRARIEEEISRKQENLRFAYAAKPIASRANTPYVIDEGGAVGVKGPGDESSDDEGDFRMRHNSSQAQLRKLGYENIVDDRVVREDGERVPVDALGDSSGGGGGGDQDGAYQAEPDDDEEAIYQALHQTLAMPDRTARPRSGNPKIANPNDNFIILSPYHAKNMQQRVTLATASLSGIGIGSGAVGEGGPRRPNTAAPLQIVRDATKLRREAPEEGGIKEALKPIVAALRKPEDDGEGKGKGKKGGLSARPATAPAAKKGGKAGKKGDEAKPAKKKKKDTIDPAAVLASIVPPVTRPDSAYRRVQIREIGQVTKAFEDKALALPSLETVQRVLLTPQDRSFAECLKALPTPGAGLMEDPLKKEKKKKKKGGKKGGKKGKKGGAK